jgi:stress response protein SCP2
MVDLPKGGNTSVVGPVIRSTLQTRLAPGDIEICALLVDQQRKARSDEDFVFFNHERSRCGSTRRLSPVDVEIDLERVPTGVDAIVIAAALDDTVTGSVADHGGGGVKRVGTSTITHTFTGLTTERCVIVAEVYRRNGMWKVRAISQGFPDLAGLIAVFGVAADERPSTTPAHAPATNAAAANPAPRSASVDAVPFETREIVDRIRAGVAARRTAGTAPPRFPLRSPNPARRTAQPQPRQLSAYRAQRRAEAQQLTADLAQQTLRLEQILRHLPLRDFSTPTLLALIDASAAQPRPPVRLFRRTGPPPPQPPPPSGHLAEPLHRLRQASNTPTNPNAIHAWLWIGLHVMDLQPSFGHPENLSVAADGAKIVVDISLPDRATYVPAHGRAVYTPGDDTIRLQPTKPKEQARLANILFSASLLAHAHAVASTVAAAGLPDTLPLVINGWEAAINPATGHPDRACRATMITDTRSLAHTDLSAVDPPTCLRSFAGTLDESGHATPIATRTATTPTERTLDLATIDPYEFERLITELAQAMGYTAYQTPRSHDHGVDVYVESRDTLAGGRIVISAKRYSHTVGPDHVRALNTVISDQGAIKGILVTTSSFGPESHRIARDKPLDLIDGEQLREWLREYLGIDARRRVLT